MGKLLIKNFLVLFFVIVGIKKIFSQPKYEYKLRYVTIDTIKDIIYLKVGVLIKNNSCLANKKIPYPMFVPHLRTRKLDSFAYTPTEQYFGNISLYIIDSVGTKFYLHEASMDCGRDYSTYANNKYITLSNNDSTLIELFIKYKYLNTINRKLLTPNNCYSDGYFYEKLRSGNKKRNIYKNIISGSTLIHNEFKFRNTIYYGSSILLN